KAFPELKDALGKLDSSFKAVGAALTLIDPDASLKDKAEAAATLATELPDIKEDLEGFKKLLKDAGVKNADQVLDQSAITATIKGLDPEIAAKLSPDELETLGALSQSLGKDELGKVLEKLNDPEAIKALASQVDGMDGPAAKRVLTALADLDKDALAKTLKDPKVMGQLGELATKLDDEAMGHVGKLMKDMDADMVRTLLKFTDGVSPDILKNTLNAIGPKLGEIDGKMVGKLLG